MINLMKNWKGRVEIDGVEYDNIKTAIEQFKAHTGDIHIVLKSSGSKRAVEEKVKSDNPVKSVTGETEYRITVKQYMTKQATPQFDFMQKWNNDKPMPIMTMTGTIVKETKGMVYMKLHGEALETITCMRCGRELTHPISRHYGIGPECMKKVGMYCDIDDISEIKEQLSHIEWEGWIIKSAITSKEEV